MRFKAPGGDLNWVTPLLFAAGTFLAYTEFSQNGMNAMGVIFAALAIGSALVWFEQRWVAIPFIGLFVLGALGGTLLLFVQGFSWRMVIKIMMSAFNAHAFWVWMHEEPDYEELVREMELESDPVPEDDQRDEWWQPKRARRD